MKTSNDLMGEQESILFWENRIKELEYEYSRNPAYKNRLDRAKKAFSDLVMGKTKEIESPIFRIKYNYSRKI